MNGFAQDFTAAVIVVVALTALFGVIYVAPTYLFFRWMGWI